MRASYEKSRDNEDKIFISKLAPNHCPPHFHRGVEILLLHQGKMDIVINNVDYQLEPMQIAVSDSYDMHYYLESPDVLNEVIVIPPKYLKTYFVEKGKHNLESKIIKNEAAFKKINEYMHLISNPKSNELMKYGYVNLMMGLIVEKLGFEKLENKEDADLLNNVIHYIENNYNKDISLKSLAQYFNYSKNYFSNLFNKNLKLNFMEYINGIRLQKFVEKYEHFDGSIFSCAKACGFASVQTFYRNFKDVFNMTPTEYFQKQKWELDYEKK